jgi:cell division protease FtsH
MIFLGRDIHENRDYSEKIAEKIDQEIDKLITEALERASKTISEQREAMDRVASKLLETETMEREAFMDAIELKSANPDNLTVEARPASEKSRVEEVNPGHTEEA